MGGDRRGGMRKRFRCCANLERLQNGSIRFDAQPSKYASVWRGVADQHGWIAGAGRDRPSAAW